MKDVAVQHGKMPIGHYPAVLGHEGVGIVRWIGSAVTDRFLRVGNTAVLSFHSCGQRRDCKNGACGSCADMTKINFLNTVTHLSARWDYRARPVFWPVLFEQAGHCHREILDQDASEPR